MKTQTKTEIQIYVACLAAYNSGHLHGEWIDVTDPDTMNEQVQAMLKASPIPNAEEWAIHDYQGFGDYRISEYSRFERLCKVSEFIKEAGEDIAGELINHYGDIERAYEVFTENYQGEYKDLGHYAESLAEDCGDLYSVPKHYLNYINFDAIGRDMELNGDIIAIDVGPNMHIFSTH